MKLLITGVAGFIGSHLAAGLLSRGDVVVGVDDFNDYYSPEMKHHNLCGLLPYDKFCLIEGDILDANCLSQVFAGGPYDCILHLAAHAGVRASVKCPERYMDVNQSGTQRLLQMAVENSVPHIVFASSSSVYGKTASPPFSETLTACAPEQPVCRKQITCRAAVQ